MPEDLVTTIQLARILKLSLASVNYYTNLGFFKIKSRKGNHRLYDRREVVAVFETIQRLRREGYPLRLIQKKLEKGYDIQYRL